MHPIEIISWALLGSIGFFLIVGLLVRSNFNRVTEHYSKLGGSSSKTGREVAHTILHRNGISDVNVVQIQQPMGDNFNPFKKLISLSPSVFDSSSILAQAISAHEVGHAIQWSTKYGLIRLRDALVKPVNFVSKLSSFVFFIGMIASFFTFAPWGTGWGNWPFIISIVGCAMFFATSIFHLVTLPVEFNASSRAKKQLIDSGITTTDEEKKAVSKALNAAALTYVVELVKNITFFALFFLLILARSQRR